VGHGVIKAPPQCYFCRHVRQDGIPREWRCAAYPDGIPEEILRWKVDHRDAYPGDRGIRFEADADGERAVKNHWRLLERARSNP